MTREELIKSLTLLKDQARNSGVNTFVWDINIDGFNFVIDSAIEALEQEPTTKDLAADREDAVERLNAIKQLIGYDKDSEIVKATQKSLDMAIKALEQESVIDKIRAEIKDYFSITCDGNCDNCNRVVKNPCGESVDGAWVLHIIDKYKAESEG